MNPILFKLPFLDVPIRAFGAMVALGFLIGSHLLGKLAERYGDDRENDPERYAKITIWILLGVIGGARLMYVIVEVARELANPNELSVGRAFLDSPLSMLAFWEGGLVMYGGFIGAVLLGMWCAKREGVRPFHAFDLGVVAGFVALAIGRVGCLLVGDDFGAVVPEGWEDAPPPIAIRVPDPLPDAWVDGQGRTIQESLFGAENVGKTLWATQIWMSLNALALGAFAYWRLRNRRYTGQVALWIVLLYAITRSFIESFRGDSIRGVWFGGLLSTSQLISVVVGAIALILLIKNRGKTDDSSPPGKLEEQPSPQEASA